MKVVTGLSHMVSVCGAIWQSKISFSVSTPTENIQFYG